jgi:hypothetical protein
MAKTSGLGDQFYVGGYDLSLDVASLDQIQGGPATLNVTGIKQLANARLGGLRSGGMQFTSFVDITAGVPPYWVDNLHTLPRTDQIGSYFHGAVVGNASACCTGKQINYDPTRDNSGNLTLKTEIQSNSFGLEWGKMLTAGIRTDTAATVGAFFDDLASSAFGGQAYFQVFSVTGTSVTIDIQHATTSGGAYSSTGLTSSAFTAGGSPATQRVSVANTTTINEFLKVVTTGTFSNAQFAVTFVRNPIAGVVF